MIASGRQGMVGCCCGTGSGCGKPYRHSVILPRTHARTHARGRVLGAGHSGGSALHQPVEVVVAVCGLVVVRVPLQRVHRREVLPRGDGQHRHHGRAGRGPHVQHRRRHRPRHARQPIRGRHEHGQLPRHSNDGGSAHAGDVQRAGQPVKSADGASSRAVTATARDRDHGALVMVAAWRAPFGQQNGAAGRRRVNGRLQEALSIKQPAQMACRHTWMASVSSWSPSPNALNGGSRTLVSAGSSACGKPISSHQCYVRRRARQWKMFSVRGRTAALDDAAPVG
jgi:hypothetical protein